MRNNEAALKFNASRPSFVESYFWTTALKTVYPSS